MKISKSELKTLLLAKIREQHTALEIERDNCRERMNEINNTIRKGLKQSKINKEIQKAIKDNKVSIDCQPWRKSVCIQISAEHLPSVNALCDQYEDLNDKCRQLRLSFNNTAKLDELVTKTIVEIKNNGEIKDLEAILNNLMAKLNA